MRFFRSWPMPCPRWSCCTLAALGAWNGCTALEPPSAPPPAAVQEPVGLLPPAQPLDAPPLQTPLPSERPLPARRGGSPERPVELGGVVGAVQARTRRSRRHEELPPVIPAIRMPLRIEFAPPLPGADPELVRLFSLELAAAMAATQRFEVHGPDPAAPPPGTGTPFAPTGPALEPRPDWIAPDPTAAVLQARIIEFVPYQPMRIRAEFALYDPLMGGAPIQLQGTWEPPPFPPGPNARPGRWRTERLPVQIAEEEMALIATSPRFFSRFAASRIAASLTDAWMAEAATAASEAALVELPP